MVVLALGTNLTMAHEAHDATSLAIPDGQLELIAAVARAARSAVVAVLLTGVPLDISPLLGNPNVGAVLHVGQPAVQTLGIGDLIFGAGFFFLVGTCLTAIAGGLGQIPRGGDRKRGSKETAPLALSWILSSPSAVCRRCFPRQLVKKKVRAGPASARPLVVSRQPFIRRALRSRSPSSI